MNGSLQKLQNAVFERLLDYSEFRTADLKKEGTPVSDLNSRATGLSVRVLQPMPTKASKYAAGPCFSEALICVEVTCRSLICTSAENQFFLCECISKILHGWNAPVESGYSKLSLRENSPWERTENKDGVTIISVFFTTQSLIS